MDKERQYLKTVAEIKTSALDSYGRVKLNNRRLLLMKLN